MKVSETFRIDVNMDFANIYHGGIFDLGPPNPSYQQAAGDIPLLTPSL